jgi:peroxiredoxin Q/BCP
MSDVSVGSKAPGFCLLDQEEKEVCLSNLKGNYVVVYFYPKDNTSGCTMEAMDFTAQLGRFEKAGVPILGISPDSPESHRSFIRKHGLRLTLLSDQEKKVSESYNVWRKKSMYGKEYMGVERSTFIIDPEGKVAAAWRKVKVPGHVEEVLAALGELLKGYLPQG